MRVLVSGAVRIVSFVVRHLAARGHRLSVVVADPTAADRISENGADQVVVGRPSDPTILEDAGARRAEVMLALGERDEENLIACQLARRLYGVPRTLALANDPDNEEVLRALGVDVAFSPVPLLASLIEQRAELEQITEVLPVASGLVTVTEVGLGAEGPVVGRSLREVELPSGGLVACVVRGQEAIVPRGDTVLATGDRLVVVAATEVTAHVLRALTGSGKRD